MPWATLFVMLSIPDCSTNEASPQSDEYGNKRVHMPCFASLEPGAIDWAVQD
jgi:hypothetical protein